MPTFDGETYSPAQDGPRLSGQLARVQAAMSQGGWWTLAELSAAAGGAEASVSARLRDLRKARNGSWVIERKRATDLGPGVWLYQMSAPAPTHPEVTEQVPLF